VAIKESGSINKVEASVLKFQNVENLRPSGNDKSPVTYCDFIIHMYIYVLLLLQVQARGSHYQ